MTAADKMLPTSAIGLKPEDQLPALGRVIHMLPDDRYQADQRVLLDSRTNAGAKEVLFRNAFNRPAEVKLPVMLAVMESRTSWLYSFPRLA